MPQKVLIIDDHDSIHALLRARLNAEPIEIHSALTGDEGLTLARTLLPDLILLDVDMPGTDGYEVCRELMNDPQTMHIPVIFLSAISQADSKIRGLELGAMDYVTKPFDPGELRARVRNALRIKYLLDLLNSKAMIDGLTGLWNQRYFEHRLDTEASSARRHNRALTIIMADLDGFHAINDRFGSPFGDEVIKRVGQALADLVRCEDVVCRMGGEEFAILCPDTPIGGGIVLANRLRERVADIFLRHKGGEAELSATFAVAQSSEAATVPELHQLLRQRMEKAKQDGKNRVEPATKAA